MKFSPFIIYPIAFGIVIILYSLDWSYLFPRLSSNLLLFILLTSILSLFLHFFFVKSRKHLFVQNQYTKTDRKIVKWILFFYILEFLYVQHVPFVTLFLMPNEPFTHFGGIPTLHVLLVTFNVFFSCTLFHKLLCSFSRSNLFSFLYLLLPSILMVNRGMFLSIFLTCLVLYLLSIRKITLKKILLSVCVVSITFYGFSIIGSQRLHDEDNKALRVFVEPTEKFDRLGLSDLILWPYIYITSPMANLQLGIDEVEVENSFWDFFVTCICPDFIRNRFAETLVSSKTYPQISSVFNVSTMYYLSFAKLGWLGFFFMFFFHNLFLISILLGMHSKNKSYTVLVALSCSITFLNTFENMWVFSAISYPLIWGPIISFFEKIKWY